ncbi:MAG: hypothetical protein LBH01_08960 [Verrucomicrobiales bacterium]|jgi:hypothetical protein|nr:hypothetical protein [Verrucomicrobiales bacterium]
MKRWFKWLFISLGVLAALIVIFYLEENWRGAREWAKVSAELKARGYPLTVKETIPPPIPDEDNVAAAPIFAELFDANGGENKEARLAKAVPFKTTPKILPVFIRGEIGDLRFYFEQGEFTMTEQEAAHKILAELDKEWMPLLAEIAEALKCPQCRWPLAYEKGFAMRMPQVDACLKISKVLTLRAICRLELGQSKEAVDDLVTIFHLAQVTEKYPQSISVLSSLMERGLAIDVFWNGCVRKQWKQEDLNRLQSLFADIDNLKPQKRTSLIDCGYFLSMQPMAKKELRNIKSSTSLINSGSIEAGFLGKILVLIWKIRPHGWEDLDCCVYLKYIMSAEELIDEPSARIDILKAKQLVVDMNARFSCGNTRTAAMTPLSSLFVSSLVIPMITCARIETQSKIGELSCALERYRLANGEVPDKLEALMPRYLDKLPVQVVNGEPFIYRKVGARDYMLYSVGWDLKDDGGKWSKSREKGDWVWASKPELYQELQ